MVIILNKKKLQDKLTDLRAERDRLIFCHPTAGETRELDRVIGKIKLLTEIL